MTKMISALLLLAMLTQAKIPGGSISPSFPSPDSMFLGQHVSSSRYYAKTEEETEAFRELICALELEKAEPEAKADILYAIGLTFHYGKNDSFRFDIDPSGLVWLNGEIETLYRVTNHENLYKELFELTPDALEPHPGLPEP